MKAVRRFASESKRISRSMRKKLLTVKKSEVGYDAAETARRLGLDAAAAGELEKVWNEVFWDPKSLRLDESVPETRRLIEAAGDRKLYFLTGRHELYRTETMRQLERLGYSVRAEKVLLKPSPGVDTPAFKRRVLEKLSRADRILYLDDSRENVSAVLDARVPVTSAVVDFPVGPRGAPKVGDGALRFPVGARQPQD